MKDEYGKLNLEFVLPQSFFPFVSVTATTDIKGTTDIKEKFDFGNN